eukprot:SAG11_NODE_2568_length_3214_cov_2.670947_3_plen_88_part_00
MDQMPNLSHAFGAVGTQYVLRVTENMRRDISIFSVGSDMLTRTATSGGPLWHLMSSIYTVALLGVQMPSFGVVEANCKMEADRVLKL